MDINGMLLLFYYCCYCKDSIVNCFFGMIMSDSLVFGILWWNIYKINFFV